MLLPTNLVKLIAPLGILCFLALAAVDQSHQFQLASTHGGATRSSKSTQIHILEIRNKTLHGMELLRHVHESPFPSSAAGQWVYQPQQVKPPFRPHLKCLNQERQGNCHNSHRISL